MSLNVFSTALVSSLGSFAAGPGDHRILTSLCCLGTKRMRRLISVIQAGRVHLSPTVTHRFKVDDIVKAYEPFGHRRVGVRKVAITP